MIFWGFDTDAVGNNKKYTSGATLLCLNKVGQNKWTIQNSI